MKIAATLQHLQSPRYFELCPGKQILLSYIKKIERVVTSMHLLPIYNHRIDELFRPLRFFCEKNFCLVSIQTILIWDYFSSGLLCCDRGEIKGLSLSAAR